MSLYGVPGAIGANPGTGCRPLRAGLPVAQRGGFLPSETVPIEHVSPCVPRLPRAAVPYIRFAFFRFYGNE